MSSETEPGDTARVERLHAAPDGPSQGPPAAPVGRDRELAAIRDLLDLGERRAAGVLLEGDVGIGKTAVWTVGRDHAAGRGWLVLAARPAESETELPFSALGDILEPALDGGVQALPPVQRNAVLVAVGMAPPSTSDTDPLVLPRAVLGILRHLAERDPVVVAIDDLHWIDGPSARVLEFVARRIADLPIRLLLARRGTDGQALPLGLDRALPDGAIRRFVLSGLTPNQLDAMLRSRLGVALPRPELLRVHASSAGNPLVALELVAASRQVDTARQPLDALAMLGRRFAELDPELRHLALLAASAGHPDRALLERLAPRDVVDRAIATGLVADDGDRIRFAHPLLATMAYEAADVESRRAAHARLATVAGTAEARALHLGQSAVDPDAEIAAVVEEGASAAAARGAPETAAILLEHAARLTPAADGPARRGRLIGAADHLLAAGDPARARGILEQLAGELPPGPERADVLWRLADAVGDDLAHSKQLCHQALAEAGDDPRVLAQVHLLLGTFAWLEGRIDESAAEADRAVGLAERTGDDQLLAIAIAERAHAETVLGRGVPREDLERAIAIEEASGEFPIYLRPSFQLGILLTYTDELDAARPLLQAQHDRAVIHGDDAGRAGVLFRLVELELRAGNWAEAARDAEECWALARQASIEQEQAVAIWARAAVAAHVGELATARAAALETLELGNRAGDEMVALRARGVLGLIELSLGEPQAALHWLDPAIERLRAAGIGELSPYRVVENAVEARAAVGDLDGVDDLVELLERTGRPTGRAWSLAVAARARALAAAGRGDVDGARSAVREALAHHERLPQPFERARTLLVAGSIERRAKQKRAAREFLGAALELFDRLGAPIWAERTAVELGRIGGREAATDRLSVTEARVAELAALGRSNKEIAAELFVSVRAVEANLTRVYAKLGVSGRAALARRLATGSQRPE